MHFIARKYLVSICLIFALLANTVAQENKYSFTWLDASERVMAGIISSNLIPQTGDGLYKLVFTVTWYDQDRKPILDVNQMPVLGLSKYDLDKAPLQHLRCITFEQNKSSGLTFSTSGTLLLQVLNGYEGQIKLIAHFQYALDQKSYDQGKSELIDFKGSNQLKMDFQVKSANPAIGTNPAKDNIRRSGESFSNIALRAAAVNYQKLSERVNEFKGRKPIEEIDRPDYLRDLDAITESLEAERSLLNPDSLPADSFQVYRDRYNQLNYNVLDLRSDFLRLRIQESEKSAANDLSANLRNDDSLRMLIRYRFDPIIRGQVDSLEQLMKFQKTNALKIRSLSMDLNSRHQEIDPLDSLLIDHGLIKEAFRALQQSHENAWNTYRLSVESLLPVSEIEILHTTFQNTQNNLQSSLDQVDQDITALQADQKKTPWYLSNLLIWIGLFAVLILVVLSTIWSFIRNKKILQQQMKIPEPGNSGSLAGKTQVPGILSNDIADEYFTINYQATIPESIVGIIHYHTSSIKTVYHLVQGALLERKGVDFGGYLFGNQYKLPGKGPSKTEIFVEKACDSRYLRSAIENNMNARADLVDELDQLVHQNKKYRLVGWFTSSVDDSMEIPEGLMKIHRSFFKEKWQIGVLLNPGSDVLHGAEFLRRRSGYLDPMPDPAAFIKWDELFRFALNPVSTTKNNHEMPDIQNKDYSRIALNNTWGDSIVTAVNFDRTVMAEITSVAAQQAIPKETYQVVGFLYGKVVALGAEEGPPGEFEVYVDRFIELNNELTPRDLPGLLLIGWWGQAHVDVMNYLQTAVDYHERSFREAYQISCLVNPSTGELRIFARKHSLEMNNNTIETEEYQLKSLLSR